jgi:hypothetical protein
MDRGGREIAAKPRPEVASIFGKIKSVNVNRLVGGLRGQSDVMGRGLAFALRPW